MNDAAFLLIEYFQYMAGGEKKDINLSDWRRLSNTILDAQNGALALLVARDGTAAVGVSGVALNGEILHTFVREGFRGKGIGRVLGEAAVREGGWFFSVLKNNASMLAAIHGARLVSEQPQTYIYPIDRRESPRL